MGEAQSQCDSMFVNGIVTKGPLKLEFSDCLLQGVFQIKGTI